ncbi:hypothetical protein [Pseudomonas chlororaphis]|uniref:hypothetical protein n=1 Tax=Pseudomonas chlororaphis TaxID=587753 RepID=UPI0015DEEA47|nr:hypothetical protein [Pseudomonas chlororaphis]QLL10857.1 hypothetical protein H0I86_17505 [Pseudomonas chlororaphis subsp. aurantiaca]QLL10863.1 hypothetical protein H0I86_17540 [Pseudomonas chlororaphis subsp. aurantiaca]
MTIAHQKPPLTDWLSRFEIALTSASPQLYPNARQQIAVTLTIQARTGKVISRQEQESLCLSVRNNTGQFSPLPVEDNGTAHWFASATRNNYSYYPSTADPAPNKNEEGGTSAGVADGDVTFFEKTFYVMSRAPEGSQETLYARVTRHMDNESYVYNTVEDPSFKTSVGITAAPIPQFFAPEHYTFDRTLVGGNGSSDLFIWEYSLAGRNMQLPVVTFRSAEMQPAGMIQWADRDPSETRASHVGYAAPGQSEFHYNPAIRLGSQFQPTPTAVRPRSGHITIVLQGSNNIPYDRDSAIGQGGPCVITAIDMYGNDHRFRVRFQDGTPTGRLALELY